jgi:hypothetical protein
LSTENSELPVSIDVNLVLSAVNAAFEIEQIKNKKINGMIFRIDLPMAIISFLGTIMP